MKYLHVAIIDETGECLVSHTEKGLRQQVMDSLALRSIPPMNEKEWDDCVKGEAVRDAAPDCIPFGTIYYYKTEEKLGKMQEAVA